MISAFDGEMPDLGKFSVDAYKQWQSVRASFSGSPPKSPIQDCSPRGVGVSLEL